MLVSSVGGYASAALADVTATQIEDLTGLMSGLHRSSMAEVGNGRWADMVLSF